MGLTKPIEQDLLNFQGTFMYPKDIIRGGKIMQKEIKSFECLESELLEKLNSILILQKIQRLYFTDFLIL